MMTPAEGCAQARTVERSRIASTGITSKAQASHATIACACDPRSLAIEIASTGITYHNYMSRDYSGDDSIAFRRRTNRLLLLLIPSLSVTRLIDSGLFHPCILPSSRSLSLSRNLSRFSSCSCGAVRKRANGTRPVSACPLSHSNMKSHLNGRNSILWRICQL
jgi:hypothetical protein